MSPRPVDLSHELRRDKRHARRELSGSIMSNTKWRIVFETLAASQLDLRQIIVKFIDVETEQRMGVPSTDAPHAYVEGSFGPFPIVSVEWVEIPSEAIFKGDKTIPAKRFVQDVCAVRAALEATGKRFALSDTEAGLRITGHVR